MKRRLVAVLAAATLAAAASLGASTMAAAEEPPGSAYVAIGDSEAAGTGNLPYVDRDCLRSARAYQSLLAGMLGTEVVSAACAGDNTGEVAMQALGLAQQGSLGPATQLVTITAGVNNIDWQGVLSACSTTGSPQACQVALGDAQAAAATIPAGIAQVIGTVRMAAPAALIVVTGYPMLFGDVTGSCSVGAFQGTPVKFTAMQTATINDGVAGVNNAVILGIGLYQSQFAAQNGFPDPGVQYLDVAGYFDGHGLCDTGERWISGLVSGKATGDRGFHPNAAGQRAYADVIAAALMP